MAQEFRLPDIGEGLTEAEIVRWLVEEGERVEADQPVVEVETDKAVVEIPSPYAGIVLKHGGAPGDVIEVGSVLLVVGEADEDDAPVAGVEEPEGDVLADDEGGDEGEDERFGSPQFRSGDAAPIVGTISEEAEVLAPRVEHAPEAADHVRALPIVRKLARDHGIDLSRVEGSGSDGRITRADVQAVIDSGAQPPRVESPQPAQTPSVPSTASPTVPTAATEDQREKMSRLRRTIAANMSKSWAEIPHVTTFEDVDATRLLETRGALAQRYDRKIPLEALVIRAVLPALDTFPEFNATLDGEELVMHASRDIGVAVDTPDGLLVAVIRDADSKGVLQLADEIVSLGEGARGRSLSVDQLTGQTFTVSNIGAVGGGHGTPIVPYGTTAILSVGRAVDKPVAYDGDLGIAPIMPLSLSYDHRVVDGAQGRRFIALLIENLEEPALFLAT
ncbi:MAG TPA: dihydrolipoamide acetyltransferase family protein [Acidimicrobiia bacterium]|nr:dihydrolipoamide acetyltransferase family protein [Acidimicrobiia bacterium]